MLLSGKKTFIQGFRLWTLQAIGQLMYKDSNGLKLINSEIKNRFRKSKQLDSILERTSQIKKIEDTMFVSLTQLCRTFFSICSSHLVEKSNNKRHYSSWRRKYITLSNWVTCSRLRAQSVIPIACQRYTY